MDGDGFGRAYTAVGGVRRTAGLMILTSLYEKFTSGHFRKVVIETFMDEIRRGSKPQGSDRSNAYRETISSTIVCTVWSCHVDFFSSL